MIQSIFTMRTRIVALASLLLVLGIAVGCDSNEPDPSAGEEEVITHVTITFENEVTQAVSSATAEFTEAGVLVSVETITLTAGETYSGSISFRNEIESEDITPEILEESEFHQLIYRVDGAASARVTVTDRDLDTNGDPLGLTFTLGDSGTTSTAGSLNVRVRHYEEDATLPEDKRNDDGTSETPGIVENDVDVTFPIAIFP